MGRRGLTPLRDRRGSRGVPIMRTFDSEEVDARLCGKLDERGRHSSTRYNNEWRRITPSRPPSPPPSPMSVLRNSRSFEKRMKREAYQGIREQPTVVSSLQMESHDGERMYESYSQYLNGLQEARQNWADEIPHKVCVPVVKNPEAKADSHHRDSKRNARHKRTKGDQVRNDTGAQASEQLRTCLGMRSGGDELRTIEQLRSCTGARPSRGTKKADPQSSLPSTRRKKHSELSKLACVVPGRDPTNRYNDDYKNYSLNGRGYQYEQTRLHPSLATSDYVGVTRPPRGLIVRNGNETVSPDCLQENDALHDSLWLAFVKEFLDKNTAATSERMLFGAAARRPPTLRDQYVSSSRSWDSFSYGIG